MNKAILIASLVLASAGTGHTEENLVPSKPTGPIYNYYCTWAAEAYQTGQGADHVDLKVLLKGDGTPGMREEKLTDKKDGWLNFYPKVRGDLWFLFDDGYYEVKTTTADGMASMVFDPKRFPSLADKSPGDRIQALSDLVKQSGWHGMGLWLRGFPGDKTGIEKLDWSRQAGVGYWKIDSVDLPMNYRRLRAQYDPDLIIEYSTWAHGVFTGKGETDMKELLPKTVFPDHRVFLHGADVVRIYDVDQPLGQITALLRTAGLLNAAKGDDAVTPVINVEDHVSIAAGLACSAGILRFPTTGKRPDGDPDIFLAGPRHVKKRMDEVVRMLRWQRIAPPLPANALPVAIDDEGFADTWNLTLGETWGNPKSGPITQSAPARISRGLPLAEVHCAGPKPFVLACRHPHGGPVSVTTLGRFDNAKGYRIPLADVLVDVGDPHETVGVFGRYASLTLRTSQPVGHVRILAQDLAADDSRDITSEVKIDGKQITIPGKLIESLGLSAATPGDESDPGLVLRVNRTP
jgi:hypothetical protein